MKLYDKTTGKTIADIVTNHSMSVDEALDLMRYTVTDDGQIQDTDTGELLNAWYDDLEMDWND